MNKVTSEPADLTLLAKQAIDAAISLDWNKAIKLNEEILKGSKEDVEAINRLARAKICLGKYDGAQKLYKKALEIDPFNIIARKNLEKITKSNGFMTNGKTKHPNGSSGQVNLTSLFLYEPGKTKIVNLLNLAPPGVLANLSCGDQIFINPKNHSVTITNAENIYLGALPDDLAHRLIAFIGGGNKYDAYVKNATPKTLSIFIREIYRSPKFATQPSFQTRQIISEDSDSTFY